MNSDTKGVEFWKECSAPAWAKPVGDPRLEDGHQVQDFVDGGGVQYRRVSRHPREQKELGSRFFWQVKMWRMA